MKLQGVGGAGAVEMAPEQKCVRPGWPRARRGNAQLSLGAVVGRFPFSRRKF
jgi:hypothetical protein